MFINTPVGPFEVPRHEANRLSDLTDEEALAEVHKGPFVDPFALGEVMRRGIYHKLPQPQVGCTMADQMKRICGGE